MTELKLAVKLHILSVKLTCVCFYTIGQACLSNAPHGYGAAIATARMPCHPGRGCCSIPRVFSSGAPIVMLMARHSSMSCLRLFHRSSQKFTLVIRHVEDTHTSSFRLNLINVQYLGTNLAETQTASDSLADRPGDPPETAIQSLHVDFFHAFPQGQSSNDPLTYAWVENISLKTVQQ